MLRTATRTLVLAAAVAALPSAASAAGSWSPPSTVADSLDGVPATIGLSQGPSVRGALGFSIDREPAAVDGPRHGAIAGVGRGAPGAPRSLAPYDLAAPPASYGQIHAVLAQRRPIDRRRGLDRLSVAFASVPGAIRKRRTLDGSVRLKDVAVAANARGEAAVAWVEDRGYSSREGQSGPRLRNDRLYLATRRPGRPFVHPAVIVGSGDLSDVSVAFGEKGDLVVAFDRSPIGRDGRPGARRVQARFRRAGHSIAAIVDLGPERGVTDIVTAISTSGRGYVAWGTRDGGIEANGPFDVYAATKPAGPHRFRDAVRLFSGRDDLDRPAGRLSLGVAGDSTGQLAFTGLGDGGLQPVLASTTDGHATFQAPVAVTGANGAVGGVAVQPDGTTTVVWAGLLPGSSYVTSGVFSATRPPRGSFPAAAQVVSATPPARGSIPAVSVARGGGPMHAAWIQQGAGVKVSRRD